MKDLALFQPRKSGLQRLESNDVSTVSSAALAKAAGVKPTQLRKDLTYFGQFGTRGLGYDVSALSKTLDEVLGTTRLQPVLLAGAAVLAALRLSDGSAIPTLPAFLEAIGGRAALVIEIKGDPSLADGVLAAVAGYDGPIVLESFDPATVARCAAAPCPVGLVGPRRSGRSDPHLLPRCDFLSWDIAHLADAAAAWPALPLTTWTVRTAVERERAARCKAQIVFEGFRP